MPHFKSLEDFLDKGASLLAKGPVALIFVEDEVEVSSTLRHHIDTGFKTVIAFADPAIPFPEGFDGAVHRVDKLMAEPAATLDVVNACIAKAPGTWFYYCYNAEYLFFPFCEHRSVGEMLTHNAEERRDSVLTYVVDLYAPDLSKSRDAVSLDEAHLDKSGYYALARPDPDNHGHPKERQLDFYGGLRWRFEEHIPLASRRIDRVALFRAKPGLKLLSGHIFNDEEYNTYACPWHHNLTAAICSFRTAKALKRNPGSTYEVGTFKWHNSEPFAWHSSQLLNLGLMEPGQWF